MSRAFRLSHPESRDVFVSLLQGAVCTSAAAQRAQMRIELCLELAKEQPITLYLHVFPARSRLRFENKAWELDDVVRQHPVKLRHLQGKRLVGVAFTRPAATKEAIELTTEDGIVFEMAPAPLGDVTCVTALPFDQYVGASATDAAVLQRIAQLSQSAATVPGFVYPPMQRLKLVK